MGEDQGTGRTTVTGTQNPEQIEREIEETREQLGDTVEALAQKTDIKAQAQQKLEDTKASMSEKTEQLLGKAKDASPEGAVSAASQTAQKARENPASLAIAGAFVTGFLAGRAFRR